VEGMGHVVGGEWMMRRERDHAGPKRGGGWMTHGSRRKVVWKMT
jgi:hypothetical protein